MSEARQMLSGVKSVTPLWIVALFISLTETILGVAVFKTTGGIQIALTVFVIAFPLLILICFFGILWYKFYVFYTPSELGHKEFTDFVKSVQERPNLAEQVSEKQVDQPATGEDKRTIDVVVRYFVRGIPLSGWMLLYACSLAYSKNKSFNLRDLSSLVTSIEYEFAVGFLAATQSMRLIDLTLLKDIVHVDDMNETLKAHVNAKLKDRIGSKRMFTELDEATKEKFIEKLRNDVKLIEDYFNR